jgi:hypothetical protein
MDCVKLPREIFRNDGQHTVQIIKNIIIPEAQNLPTLFLQEGSPPFVIVNLFLMLTAIDLDHYFLLNAGKISDVLPYGVLAAETVAVKLLAS